MNKIIKTYVCINALYAFSFGLTSTIIGLFLHSQNFSYTEISLYSFIFWVGCFLLEVPSGFIADIISTKYIIFWSSILRGSGLFLVIFSNKVGVPALLFGGVIAALGEALKSGTMEAWISNEIINSGGKSELMLIFSKSNVIVSIVSLLSGYTGAKIFERLSIYIPFYLAMICFVFTAVFGLVYLKDSTKIKKEGNDKYKEEFKELIIEVRKNKSFIYCLMLFLPFLIISTAPFNQWTLAFGELNNTTLSVGEILIFIKLASMIGSYLARYCSRFFRNIKGTYQKLMDMVVICILLISVFDNQLIKILFFLIQVIIVSIIEVVQLDLLNNVIDSKKRTSFISIKNTVDSIVSMVIIGLIGILADYRGFYFTWSLFAFFGIIILHIVSRVLSKKI